MALPGPRGLLAKPAAYGRAVMFLSDRYVILGGMARPRQFDPDEVIDRSMREFWERGYRETSVDDLVEATGVQPGSLYNAFPGGKRGLFLRALDRYSKLVVPQNLGALAAAGAGVAGVRAFVAGLVDGWAVPA